MTIKQKTIGWRWHRPYYIMYVHCTQVPNTQRDIVLCDYLYYSIIYIYILCVYTIYCYECYVLSYPDDRKPITAGCRRRIAGNYRQPKRPQTLNTWIPYSNNNRLSSPVSHKASCAIILYTIQSIQNPPRRWLNNFCCAVDNRLNMDSEKIVEITLSL